jgi:chemotaxis methyl-accepting protein methylase
LSAFKVFFAVAAVKVAAKAMGSANSSINVQSMQHVLKEFEKQNGEETKRTVLSLLLSETYLFRSRGADNRESR